VRTDRQKAYNPHLSSNSNDAAVNPSDHAGPGSTDKFKFSRNISPNLLRITSSTDNHNQNKVCQAAHNIKTNNKQKKTAEEAFFIQ
jgi:hypothetical protein